MPEPVQPPPRPKRHWFLRITLTILGLLVLIVALAYWRVRAPIPDVSGTIHADGLRSPVSVIRDVDNVPHIRAENEADALFALGYVHAQERLWQMEFQRRVAWGRLSEFAGPTTLDTDRLMRTIGIGRAAAESWPKLDPEARASIESYVAGINAFLAEHRGGSLPVEFALLRISPEPFRGEDVIAWYKTMSWVLSMNWGEELLRERMSVLVGTDGANQLLPAYAPTGPVVLPPDASPLPLPSTPLPGVNQPLAPVAPPRAPTPSVPSVVPPARLPIVRGDPAVADLSAALGRALDRTIAPPRGGGSNGWVVSGARTITGKPLLANDPHLAGAMPGIWFMAHVSGGTLDAIGATIPGMPGVLIGHNARIAWGVTAFMADTQDLFIEHVNTADQVEFAGAWEPLRIVREVIKVRGSHDVPLRVRLTRHGPLISDVIEHPPAALALKWTGHDAVDPSAAAVMKVGLATSWEEFNAALSLTVGPALNFVYADIGGNIGYVGAGAFPVRTDSDGRRPVPGWTGEHEWRGYVHESEWPRSFNPGRGYLVSANNKVVPDSYPFPLGTSWDAPYRAARIVEMIETGTRLAPEDFGRMQRDVRTSQAALIVPFLMRARPLDTAARDAMERLRGWDGTMSADSPEAALYDAWYAATVRGMFEDDLGPALFRDYLGNPSVAAKAMANLVDRGETTWCDDVRTPEPETCATLLGRTLQQALVEMGERQGSSDIGKWRWDRVNQAVFPHRVFDTGPLLKRVFSRRVPAGGNAFTIAPVMLLEGEIFTSSYRQIIDLAALDASLFVIPAGQSGHVWSKQYDDLLPKWSKAEYLPMRFTRETVDAASVSTLILEPQ